MSDYKIHQHRNSTFCHSCTAPSHRTGSIRENPALFEKSPRLLHIQHQLFNKNNTFYSFRSHTPGLFWYPSRAISLLVWDLLFKTAFH